MYAIRIDGEVYPERFGSWDEAVEFAQEGGHLPPGEPWDVVHEVAGEWVVAPAAG